ncbi:MAG: hypothetical protein ACYDB7_10890, partial [Mycobacteriales bacterium]
PGGDERAGPVEPVRSSLPALAGVTTMIAGRGATVTEVAPLWGAEYAVAVSADRSAWAWATNLTRTTRSSAIVAWLPTR